MRDTQTVTISLPPDLAEQVDKLARREGRTRSDLLREAFRQYAERRARWDAIFGWGERLAAEQGLTEEAVAQAVTNRRRARSRSARG